ncbi:phosphoribosylformylglycinamidine cyclo-ligase [Venenivibrio stagnispumantis]|uniref:Phosphoribosylformylglycinamidine cyclo-ligase n=1 Tax=Venenivibrio stagnispumantis TaxID=407998 RepID=A0AA46ADL6_9AQUI|nr:phosphoribosylformylglycinamidine cyclo-ligase [Venenivibrio stagnispumantis]MCW4573945.1 phosphoribosylformylglycinamidine cyclo-ligase [Venenivibrio stagnispumantis]SMP05849.1 phosphoribosylformylglycinamidine cyclo-ligase [Venenivibrio stagnispumantis]
MLTYKDAGVDIEKADKFVSQIKGFVQKTFNKNVITPIGGFASAYLLDIVNYKEPVITSSTDGVGTKLKIAQQLNKHDTIGIDLVAMCVNDLITTTSKPLFFLDYFATGKLEPETAATVIKGIAKGCEIARCALVGGETAEMPGMYKEGEYDLAGFAVGVVEKSKMVDGSKTEDGNILIGLASSGVHSNGYSLVRKIIELKNHDLKEYYDKFGKTLGEELLTPTKIYVDAVLTLAEKIDIKAIAHITGGGIPGNLIRVINDGLKAVIEEGSWEILPIFKWIEKEGNVPKEDMYKTFNMGIGLIIAIDKKDEKETIKILEDIGEKPYIIGYLTKGEKAVEIL